MRCSGCSRINRIRLEFKVKHFFFILKYLNGINRIRLEFKGAFRLFRREPHTVLIESDWNLKEHREVDGQIRGIGINRIRLEFKEQGVNGWTFHWSGINRIRLEFKVNQTDGKNRCAY